jgi:hypothetical protein
MDLTFAQERLTREFAGSISAETVTKCLEDVATSIAEGARILVYIPLLAEHSARNRLAATINRGPTTRTLSASRPTVAAKSRSSPR